MTKKVQMKLFDSPKTLRPPSEDQLEKRRILREQIAAISLYGVTSQEEIDKIKAKIRHRANWSPGGQGGVQIGRRSA